MTEPWTEIVADHRLTPDARICALYLMSLGPDWHHISFRRWRSLLNNASRERVRDALGLLEEFELVQRENGGSRADRYLWGENLPNKNLSGENQPDSENLLGEDLPHSPVYGEESFRTNLARDAVPAVVEDAPPETRAKFKINPRADDALDDRFAGCRDAIRDTLRDYVPPKFHYRFVMSLLSYIQQALRLVDAKGHTIPADEIPALIAKTCNELGPEIGHAHNPTRKVTANLQGIASRVNSERRGPKPADSNGKPSGYTQEEYDALAG